MVIPELDLTNRGEKTIRINKAGYMAGYIPGISGGGQAGAVKLKNRDQKKGGMDIHTDGHTYGHTLL